MNFLCLMIVYNFVFYVTYLCNDMLVLYYFVLSCMSIEFVFCPLNIHRFYLLLAQIHESIRIVYFYKRFCDMIYYEKFHDLLQIITDYYIKLSDIRCAYVDCYRYITKCYYSLNR